MTEIWLFFALLSFVAWMYLLIARGGYWLTRERSEGVFARPARWPSVTAVVPARDEADVIARSIGSLLRQDYPGEFRIVLVDDQSADGTVDVARSLADPRLSVVRGSARPDGWTGKLWAVAEGIAYAAQHEPSDYLWLTDADIAHAPQNLRTLVGRAEAGSLVLVSEMAKLHCASRSERFLIPAFVYFFRMLYPFQWVNESRDTTAAAAGGSMLARRDALIRAGGIEAIRGEIIDDCALARLLKTQGGIWLGLSEMSESIRPYIGVQEIGRMVSRSAYSQLFYSPWLLAGTVIGMCLLFAVPPLAVFSASGPTDLAGVLAWLAMTLSFQPILRFYRLSPLWGLALPLMGLVYTAFTIDSALQYWQGRGGMWKGRAQAVTRA